MPTSILTANETLSPTCRENPAIARCWRAYRRAYNQQLESDENEFVAHCHAAKVYLRALPDLSSLEKLRDFIACVSFAAANDLIIESRSAELLKVAKVAIAAFRLDAEAAKITARKNKKIAKQVLAAAKTI
jgi:hypothetical protein